MTTHNRGRVSPFGHPRINALLTTPRGITQSHTSFIGSACQGIHHAPFSNKHNNTHPTTHRRQRHVPGYTTHTHTKNILQRRKMLASTIQFSHTTPTTTNHTNSDQQTVSPKQEQPPTHHTTTVMQPAGTMCCPRHPTVHQQFINVWNYSLYQPSTRLASCQPGMCPPGYFTKQWQHHARVLNHQHPQLWAK